MQPFETGQIIVRDDHKYPNNALVVDGFSENGEMLAHPMGGGLQFVLEPSETARFQRVELQETIQIFSPSAFCIECSERSFFGWSDGSSWNGWEKPCFTREVAERILATSGYRWSYDASADEFTVATSEEEDEPERFTGETIHLGDGGSVTAYFVGAGSWVWDKI